MNHVIFLCYYLTVEKRPPMKIFIKITKKKYKDMYIYKDINRYLYYMIIKIIYILLEIE